MTFNTETLLQPARMIAKPCRAPGSGLWCAGPYSLAQAGKRRSPIVVERESAAGLVAGCADDAAGKGQLVRIHIGRRRRPGRWPRKLPAAVELILPNAFASVAQWGPDPA
jgi:hypothetical protein